MELSLIFLLGLCVGSFANVLIDRLPQGQDVLRGRSRCDFCKKTLRWFELIPLLSFLFQKGRCLRCHRKLSWQYPLVELATGFGFVLLFPAIPAIFIFIALLVIFVADLKYEIIPDSMIALGVIGGIGGIGAQVVVGVGASLFFFALYVFTRGRGMGFGDVKLVFFLGLILGFPAIVVALYVAFLTGATVGVILIIRGKKKLKSHLPFGPFLIWGTFVAIVYGNVIMRWWNRLI